MKLADAQIRQYQQDGFLVVGNLFSKPEIALLRDEAAMLGTPQRGTPGANVYEKKTGRIRQSYASEQDSEAWELAYRLPKFLEPVHQLLGEQVYLWHSRIIFKLAHVGEQWQWHQDFTSWHMDGAVRGDVQDMISIMVMLDDTTPENGPVRFVPGSHLAEGAQEGGVLDWHYDFETTAYPVHTTLDEHIDRMTQKRPVVECTGPAGTVVFFTAKTVHSSTDNVSSRDRRIMYLVYNSVDNMPATMETKRPDVVTPYYLNGNRTILEMADETAFARLVEQRGLAA
jgi:ectoine hydroxylase